MKKEEINAIKNKIAALRLKHSEKMGKIHKRKTHEHEMFQLEMSVIQSECSHPERDSYGLVSQKEECLICGKVWEFFE